jgi:hypothetical protein
MHRAVFRVTGTATFDGVRGYLLHFTIVVGDTGRMQIAARVVQARQVLDHQFDAASAEQATVFASGVPVDLTLLF